MSGDISLVAHEDSILVRALSVLGGLPQDPPWVLVGGLAIFCRLGSVTRPTQDADTIAADQRQLTDMLGSQGRNATVVSAGRVEVHQDGSLVKVDIIDLESEFAADPALKTAFRLAKHFALDSAERVQIVVHDLGGKVVVDTAVPVATAAALTALKTVSLVGRPSGKSPHKIGSDIHDLVRLVQTTGAQALAIDIASVPELARWTAKTIEHYFVDDLRYTVARLRSTDRSPGAMDLTDEDLAATAILAAAIETMVEQN